MGVQWLLNIIWSKFGNDSVRNVVIFGNGNGSSSHTDNRRNHFLILIKGDTFCINGSFGGPEKSLVLISVKQRQNVAGVCIAMVIIAICLLTEKNL